MALALRHGVVPGTLHLDAPTPHVDWSAGAVELVTKTRAWPRAGRPRRAAVSSFGLSGTNAHVILEQAPEPAAGDEPPPLADRPAPWVLSAKSPAALRPQPARLAGCPRAGWGGRRPARRLRRHGVARRAVALLRRGTGRGARAQPG